MPGALPSLLDTRAQVFKALGHPTRLWIVEKLSEGECCVCQFVDQIEADFSTVSKHLSVLKQAGLITDEKRGKQVFYRLRMSCVIPFMSCLDAALKAQAKEQLECLHS